MDIKPLDLNLLRLFDAVWRLRSVSRAAEELGLSQPAASQGLARLRRHLGDALFARSAGGVTPTPFALQLAEGVQTALAAVDQALAAPHTFHPARSERVFRLHLSDIGEARFLPEIMDLMRQAAPRAGIDARSLPHSDVAEALHAGQIDLAIGYLPTVRSTSTRPLITDTYVVVLRQDHPVARRWRAARAPDEAALLAELEFAAVRSHADTLRILSAAGLESRVRLTASNFLSLPLTVAATDLAVLMPRTIAQGMRRASKLDIIEPAFPSRDMVVSLHWSRRFEHDPATRWLREAIAERYPAGPALDGPKPPRAPRAA